MTRDRASAACTQHHVEKNVQLHTHTVLVAHTYIDWSTCKQSLAIWLALHRAVPCLREGAPLLPLLTTPNMCRATAAMLRIAQHHLPFSRCLRTGCNPSSTSVLATFLLLWLAACPSHKHMTGVAVHGTGTPATLPANNHLSLPWWSCKFGTPTSANPAAQLTQLNYKTPTC